ncbi:hypothetical protein ABH977_005481 [Bradyrhizobium ottawaense]
MRTPRTVTGPARRAARKQPLLVEHAVVWQIAFEAKCGDAAAVEQRAGIVEFAVFDPGRADQHGRPAIGGLSGQCLDRGAAGRLEGRLLHEVLRRIAGDEQFRKQHEIGAVGDGSRARIARLGGVALDVAQGRIELGERDRECFETFGHGRRAPIR